MAAPIIKIYHWTKRSGTWAWWDSIYTLNGQTYSTDAAPIMISGPTGTGTLSDQETLPSLVSDSVFSNGLQPFATVPICIVHQGGATLEEMNIEIASHFWAKGRADGTGDFANWWTGHKNYFGTTPSFTSTNGFTSYDNLNDAYPPGNSTSGLGYLDGTRVPPATATEDTTNSQWKDSPSNIYDPRQAGIGFIQDSNGDSNLSESNVSDLAVIGNRVSLLGDVKSATTLARKGFYDPTNYRSTYPFTGEEGIINTFTRQNASTWTDANLVNIWRMGHVWNTRNNRRVTPFNYKTVQNVSAAAKYNLVFTNSDTFGSYRILRGYVYVTVCNPDSFVSYAGSSPNPLTTTFEGGVFGRYFFSLAITGRYYD